jgi:hypothetical protein
MRKKSRRPRRFAECRREPQSLNITQGPPSLYRPFANPQNQFITVIDPLTLWNDNRGENRIQSRYEERGSVFTGAGMDSFAFTKIMSARMT